MIRKVLVFGIVFLFLGSGLSWQSVNAENEISTNPKDIYFTLFQGETKTKEIEIKNEGNKTMKGELIVDVYKCADRCPYASLSIKNIELKPNEEIKTIVKVESRLANDLGDYDFRIWFQNSTDDFRNATIIGTIHVKVVSNYFVYMGIPLAIIGIIAIVLIFFLYKRKKKEANS